MTAHSGVENPAATLGSAMQRLTAFVAAFRCLKNRITTYAALPVASLGGVSLQARLTEIGQGEGATRRRPDVA